MRKPIHIVLLLTVLLCWTAQATIYYVAVNGNNSNNGTSTGTPFATVTKALSVVSQGDTIYIRGNTGVYYQTIYDFGVSSGASGNPILITTYPGDPTAVFDGTGVGASPLIGLYMNWTIVSNIIEQNNNIGMEIFGTNDLLIGCMFQSNQNQGGLIYGPALSSRIAYSINHDNDLGNYRFKSSSTNGAWGSGLSIARGAVSNTIDHCITYHNWGEGLSTFQATNSILSNNISFDNKTECYISDAHGALAIGNVLYSTPGNAWYGPVNQIGIYLNDETYSPPSEGVTIIDNFSFGNTMNFACDGMTNFTICNNTFADATDTTHGNIEINLGSGLFVSSIFINNLIVQDNPAVPIFNGPASTTGLTWATNQWSSTPNKSYPYGNGGSVAAPNLREIGSATPGWFTPDWAIPYVGSPVIQAGNASTNYLGIDIYGNTRTTPPNVGAVDGPGVTNAVVISP